MLKLKGIVKSFDGLAVLRGIDLKLGRGEFICLLGPSGCGKTTLLNIICGLVRSDSGRIYLNGKRVESCRGYVAYMQQKDLLLPWRRALDNAALSLEVQGLSRETARLRAHELFEKFGLGGFERKYPQELSGGMRQRVALIRTLLSQKEIMLLDEPFGSLDSMTRGVLHKFLLDIWKGFRRTVLFVTHDLEEAISLSDRIYVLTARPSKVKEVVEVPLPRPRQPTDEGFIKIKGRLLELIEGEVHALED